MRFDLAWVSSTLGCRQAPNDLMTPVTGWSVDSRTLAPGDLFFALRGPNHDGHDHVGEAFARGAAAAVVEDPVAAVGRLFAVSNVQEALEDLARFARDPSHQTLVGVTGSAGKTTTKDIIAALLAVDRPVAKTEGNLNNHIGVPLTLLRMSEEARVAVVEMGMNHPGEIAHMCSYAQPDAGVVTNVGLAHAEFFRSADEVALAKRELIEALRTGGGVVLNADDPRVLAFREIKRGPIVTFGVDNPEARVRAEDIEYRPDGVRFRVRDVTYESSLIGRHSLMNILAGIATTALFGIHIRRVVEAVRELKPSPMRGEQFVHASVRILNDCYNANPEAVHAMLELLRTTPAQRRFAVLGEMRELGRWSEDLHREVGRAAARGGIDVLVGIRGAARALVEEAIRSGLRPDAAFFFEDPAEAGRFLRGRPQPEDAVLFKGSRATHVERALEAFVADTDGPAPGAE